MRKERNTLGGLWLVVICMLVFLLSIVFVLLRFLPNLLKTFGLPQS